MFRVLLALCLMAGAFGANCPMKPAAHHTSVQRYPGDGGYNILISGTSDKYIPNAVYTISLQGSRTHARFQQFTRFTLSVESQYLPDSPISRVGFFQLFPDSLTAFNEDCVNTISEATDYPKSEVQVMWKAPAAGSGCVVFNAMVLESFDRWYAEDGNLTKIFCEFSETERANELNEEHCCACDEAKYSLIFEGIWSNQTHPKDFPFSLWLTHFSDLVGASHEPSFSFWGRDHVATDGFRQLAEWGIVSGVESELKLQSKHLRTLIKAAGLWYPRVNTNTTTSFKVDRKHPLLSAASMLGPSPDWVVGVNKLNLCQKDCSWIKSMIIDLYPWDAGTDNGISYMSPNSETKPREKMKPITTSYPEDPRSPFYDPSGKPMLPLARFYLNRETVTPKSCDEDTLREQIQVLEIAENTEDTSRPECITTEYTDWSACSVSCGKGLRMRTREYLMPQKAQMLGCNRQLVSKEMCVAEVPECPGQEEEVEPEILSVNTDEVCRTSDWSGWSECSNSCGIGVKMRTRSFLNHMGRKKCPHVSTVEKEKCMEPPCAPGTEEVPDPLCKVTDWSDWSPCSASCGKGVKLRTRLLMVDPSMQQECSSRIELLQQRPCEVRSDCTFDMAEAKVVCMEEADPGPCRGYWQRWAFQPAKLMCVPFGYGGCRGNRNNFLTSEECTRTCGVVRAALTGQPILTQGSNQPSSPAQVLEPIDCMLSPWFPWSPCSASCGPAQKTRFRMIKRPAANGGRACPKKLTRTRPCRLRPC